MQLLPRLKIGHSHLIVPSQLNVHSLHAIYSSYMTNTFDKVSLNKARNICLTSSSLLTMACHVHQVVDRGDSLQAWRVAAEILCIK
jgi:hypothetical protein